MNIKYGFFIFVIAIALAGFTVTSLAQSQATGESTAETVESIDIFNYAPVESSLELIPSDSIAKGLGGCDSDTQRTCRVGSSSWCCPKSKRCNYDANTGYGCKG